MNKFRSLFAVGGVWSSGFSSASKIFLKSSTTTTFSLSTPNPTSCTAFRLIQTNYPPIIKSTETVLEDLEREVGVEKEEKIKRKEEIRGYDKDRTKIIPVEVSMRYLKSNAYKETYGDNLVWSLYRRNFKGQYAPWKTRRTCIRKGMLATGNPCPICRDEYLVLDYRNVDLLKQFISPFNGEVLGWAKTGICRTTQLKLEVEVKKAKDKGTITFDVPFRSYDYSEYEQVYESYKSESGNN